MKNKNLMLLGIVLAMGLLTCGCMITHDDYLKAAEKYMKKKYGEEFEGKYFYGITNDSMYVTPINHPDWYVTVTFEKPSLTNVKFHDNYVAFLLNEELEDKIENMAREAFGDCKVFCAPMGWTLPDEWDKHTDLEEYNTKKNISTIRIFVAGNLMDYKEKEKHFIQIYSDKNININIVYIYFTSPELLPINNSESKEMLEYERYYWKLVINIKGNDEEKEIESRWTKGKI